MAEDQQDLLPNFAGSEPGPQRATCRRGGIVSALSILVALLVAVQAATVYFLVQQHNQVAKLKDSTNEMKMKMLSEQLHSRHPAPQKKQPMAMIDKPLRVFDPDEQPPKVNLTKLEYTAKNAGKMEDPVKPMIVEETPQLALPDFNDPILENLNTLKSSFPYEQDWKDFQSSPDDSKAETDEWIFVPEAPAWSKCQMEANGRGILDTLIGQFTPQCTDSGDYLAKQCHRSVGFCWCVYKNGTEIPGTRTRGLLDCTGIHYPEGSTFEFMDDDL